jgi:formiminoglutamase
MPVETVHGDSPLIIVLPYTGSNIPRAIYRRLNEDGRTLRDTDSYLDRLVADLAANPTWLRVAFHRYVSDADARDTRPGAAWSKGMVGVVPLVDRTGAAIWDEPPKMTEAANWRAAFYAPFHAALNAQVARVRARHGHAVLVTLKALHHTGNAQDCHMSVSTNMAASCSVTLSATLTSLLMSDPAYRCVLNGRSAAGRITRQHGRPDLGIHALQLGIQSSCYLSTDGEIGHYDAQKAEALRQLLTEAFSLLSDFSPA